MTVVICLHKTNCDLVLYFFIVACSESSPKRKETSAEVFTENFHCRFMWIVKLFIALLNFILWRLQRKIWPGNGKIFNLIKLTELPRFTELSFSYSWVKVDICWALILSLSIIQPWPKYKNCSELINLSLSDFHWI